ncbi:MAG: DedA family protein, partial [Alphaproteobacteria bacterium]|nr:DedA family protein [Alphaproteobacteria bacterium]
MAMLRRLYDWTMGLAGHRHADSSLFAVSFIESSVFPIPPDVLMIPMVLARRQRAFIIATIATVGSVLGALLGYWIGAALMDTVGQWVLTAYGKEAAYADLAARFAEYGGWAVLIAAVTPFPFKVIT